MLEFDKKHKSGKKTFFYLFIIHCWWLMLIGIGFIYLAWLTYFGTLHTPLGNFLAGHPTWYVDSSMVSQWMLFLGLAFLLIAYLEANVYYRTYKFILDEYAVHLHRGLFFIREITIPYQQISNVHIERPYHYRMFGIAKLDIVTAADKSMEERMEVRTKKFLIPIIDVWLARKLSRQLLESASKIRNGKKIYTNEEEFEDDEEFEEEEYDETGDEDEVDTL